MAWTVWNFKTKKQLKDAVRTGKKVRVFQPGPYGPDVPDGKCVLEGPHEGHKWYAQATVKGGYVVSVK